MSLPLEGIKPGGNYPWAEYVKATLCDEHHQIVEIDPENYFQDRVTTRPNFDTRKPMAVFLTIDGATPELLLND